jgi:hypothetical protein
MKAKLPLIAMTLVGSFLLSGCDPGLWEYGYLYNPKGVIYRLYEALRTNDSHDDWGILFDGKMTCVYSSEEGVESLKRALGNLETVADRFSALEPERLTNLPGEQYRLRVLQRANGAPALTFRIRCTHEKSNGSTAHFCQITDLKNHITGTPKIEVCESL